MSFQNLYDWVQAQSPKIKTNAVKSKIIALGSARSIDERWFGFNPEILRGVIVRGPLHINAGHIESEDDFLICLSRLSPRIDQRFLRTKELMHVFDEPNLRVRDGSTLEQSLAYLAGKGSATEPASSEVRAYWRALAILCPEATRQELISKRAEMKNYDVIARIQIPEWAVSALFDDAFLENLDL